MKHPPKGQVWIHVDRLDRDDGKVWAVQSWDGKKRRYDVAAGVVLNVQGHTQFFGPKAPQPKAVIVVPAGRVTMRGDVVVVDW